MKSRILPWLMLFLIAACTPWMPEGVKYYPNGLNTAVLDLTTVVSSNDSLVFESQFSFLDLAGHYDIGQVSPQDFIFTSPGHYTILDFKDSIIVADPRAATLVLEDESGNYDSLDALNYRSKMINKFCQDTGDPGGFLVGGYSSQGEIPEPAEFFSDVFSTDWRAQQDFLFGLAQRTGGKSSLYDALVQALELQNQNAYPYKNIVVLARRGNEVSTATAAGVISAAIAAHVSIHLLYFGASETAGELPQLSAATGGLLAMLPTDGELITVFSQLHRLLYGERHVYKVKISYRPESGILGPDVTHILKIRDYTNGKDYNPVVIYTKIP